LPKLIYNVTDVIYK